MVQILDKYSHVQFAGKKSRPVFSADFTFRPVREAPSASIFARSPRQHPPIISPADRLLVDEVFRRLQLNAQAYRPSALGRRVSACLRALYARSPAEALRRLEEDPSSADRAINALLIGVTAFFRDTPVFLHLCHTAIPDLVRHSPAPRILSVGCSDGAEVYSLAISLLEAGVSEFSLRGIDCRRRAIERARTGHYPVGMLASAPALLCHRYFDREPRGFQVKDSLRQKVAFQLADAFNHIPSPPYDLIACRNLAIYLEHPVAARLWRRLHAALRPGGLLITGKAEHPTAGFTRAGPCLFRKGGGGYP